MRASRAVPLLVLAAAMLGTVAPGDVVAAGAARPCARGRSLTTGVHLRVVRYRGAVYSCRGGGRPLRLSYDFSDRAGGQLVFDVRVAGRFVAFNQVTFNSSGDVYLVEVVDTRARRRVRAVSSGIGAPDDIVPVGSTGIGQTTQILLRQDGSLAWIARDDFQVPGSPQRYELWQAQAGRHPTLVAQGTDIDPRSLAASGHDLYWTAAGQPHATPFR